MLFDLIVVVVGLGPMARKILSLSVLSAVTPHGLHDGSEYFMASGWAQGGTGTVEKMGAGRVIPAGSCTDSKLPA